jgi:hypothetical protein
MTQWVMSRYCPGCHIRFVPKADMHLFPSPWSIEDCYCFSTLNPKIAFVPSGPLKDHTLNLHSDDLLPLRSGAPVYGPNEG